MKIYLVASIICVVVFVSCSKKDGTVDSPGTSYLTTSANSTWNYQETDSSLGTPSITNYTITSTNRDTALSNRTYHVYTNTNGGFRFQNVSGNDYYQLDSLPAGLGTSVFERLYLKDNGAINTAWTQTLNVTLPGIPLPVPVTLTNTIVQRDMTRAVSGVSYNNVIHTSTSITSALIPAEF